MRFTNFFVNQPTDLQAFPKIVSESESKLARPDDKMDSSRTTFLDDNFSE